MKKYVHLTLVLFIIAALSGFILGVVNDLTKKEIALADAKKLADGIKDIFPNLNDDELTKKENKIALNEDNLTEYYIIYDDSENIIGYVFNVDAPKPYKGIKFIVGINTDGEVEGISYLDIQETPGLGTKITDDDFTDQFIGLNDVSKADTISGATKSSTAVKKGIEMALAYYNEELAGGAQNE